jgi:glycosyltransferase involved in cell wall biosynthesis
MRQHIQSLMASYVLPRADAIRAVSLRIKTYLVSDLSIPEGKVTVAPVYSDIESARRAPITVDLHKMFPQFDRIILMASRLVKQKNIPMAIEAFDIFRKKHPRVGLVIAGSGPEEGRIRRLIADKGMDESVKMGSWTKEFYSCMKTCDAFLISSDYEGWGMTAVEAASLGKLVIMTDVGCAGEFIIDGKNGLVVPVGDADAMADALGRAAQNRFTASPYPSAFSDRKENDRLMLDSWKKALAWFYREAYRKGRSRPRLPKGR